MAADPTRPLPSTAVAVGTDISSHFFRTAHRVKYVVIQKSSIIDTPDARHANTFIMKATLDGSTSNMLVITAPIIWYSGAPGGCPTSSFTAVEVYSGQSHNGVVGSVVMMYTVDATANISHPRTVFMFLNVGFICMVCNFFSFP